MSTRICPRRAWICLACLIVLLGAHLAPAHLVILKDGFTLHGEVKQQTTNFIDPISGQQIEVAQLGGFFMVDDGARRIVFSHRQVSDVDEKDPSRDADVVKLSRSLRRLDNFRLPPQALYLGATDWDPKWERVFTLQGPRGRIQIPQRLTVLTPHYTRVDALRYFWTSYFLTRELGPGLVRKLLYEHPDLKLTGGGADADRRFRVFRFFVQAGWFDEAEAELQELYKAMPDQKERVDAAREQLRDLRAARLLEEIETARQAGRYRWAREQLSVSLPTGIDQRLRTRLATLRSQDKTARANLVQARRFLLSLPGQVEDVVQRKELTEAAAVIAKELTPETVNRLQAFASLAKQAERERANQRTPDQTPAQLLALAASGWLLGNEAAETKVDTALRLWRTRRLVLDYQKTHDPIARKQMLRTYEQEGAVPFDELEHLIRFLPPPEPFVPWGVGPGQWQIPATYWLTATQLAAGHWPLFLDMAPGRWPGVGRNITVLKLTTDLPTSRRRGPDYHVQLPPEYQPGRSYPVLFLLHHAGDKPFDMLARCSDLGARHGYILVAPVWQQGLNERYAYTPDEHAAVLDVLLDLRRRFQVDSDRVFLFGWGEGGSMAYDVGLSHPDLFAGVIPMGSRPRYFSRVYWRNGQYLPFYVIDGDLNGDSPTDNRRQFKEWVPRGYPALYIEYKGRVQEWFHGELPYIFDWMSRKKRAAAFPVLGKSGGGGLFGEEFQSMRSSDNRFYWLSALDIIDRCINEAGKWNGRVIAASLQARIGEGNRINVSAKGFKQVTVWLGKGMIDFDKPANVMVNLKLYWPNRKVTPSLETLLEDLYERGDRQRLYWARLDFKL